MCCSYPELSVCVIRVKLMNKGVDAYKHDLFGDAITVERRITEEGQSSYKLKDGSGSCSSHLYASLH